MKQLVRMLLALLCIATCPGCPAPAESIVVNRHDSTMVTTSRDVAEPAPTLVVTINPSNVKIDDTAKQGTPLAAIAVSWSNGAPYTGTVRLTKNPGGICQLAGMELRLGRDTTKTDDYTTSVCTVTATE
jgi:hypothetical protein